jgi:hypothetical protein
MEADVQRIGRQTPTEERKHNRGLAGTKTRSKRLYDLLILFNGLLVLFVALLLVFIVFAFYLTEIPQVVISPGGVENFGTGKTPTIYVRLSNIGRTDAKAVHYGLAVGLLPFPLNDLEFEKIPLWAGLPVRLFPNTPLSISGTLPALAPNQFNAVRDGQHWLVYIWGTVEYRDFFYIWGHRRDFCFAYGGADLSRAGVCTVNHTGVVVRLTAQQEPQTPLDARPNPAPLPP